MILSAVDAVYKFSRPLLFRLDPELTHNAANALLKRFGSLLPPYQPSPALNQDIFSQSLKSPVGLSAGFDKYGTLFPMMSRLGLDFSELGSFTALAQEGNPRPRVRRLLFEKALLNKMGFNNPGLEDGLGNIKELLKTYRGDHKIAISLGRSKTTKNNAALKEYELLMKKINLFLKEDRSHETSFFYTAVNLSSPNTPGLRELQDAGALSELIRTLKKASTQPLVVKFSPDFRSSREFMRSLEAATDAGADGFILTNTSTNYRLLKREKRHAQAFGGGLSGAPIADVSKKYLKDAWSLLKGDRILIASGGVMTPRDGWERILLGASLVQVYTGLVYNGPEFAIRLQKYILKQLEKHQLNSIEEAMEHRDYIRNTLEVNKT